MLYALLVVASWAGAWGAERPLGLEAAPDWLLTELQPAAPKRITPKSVFVAPTFSACGPGYRHDPAAGRCVRIVKVNQQAQWDFFLQKLNAMYAPPEPTKVKAPSGPLHIRLPLVPSIRTTRSPPTTPQTTEISTTTTEVPTTSTTPYTSTSTTLTDTTTEAPSTFPTTETTTSTPVTTTEYTTNLPSSTYTTFREDQTYPSTFEPWSETITEYTPSNSVPTYTEPIASANQHFSLPIPAKRKCSSSIQVSELGSEFSRIDCDDEEEDSEQVKPAELFQETSYPPPVLVRFPQVPPRQKPGYVRFPDRTWSNPTIWWPHPSWERVPVPLTYQKVQYFPPWHRKPEWARSSRTTSVES